MPHGRGKALIDEAGTWRTPIVIRGTSLVDIGLFSEAYQKNLFLVCLGGAAYMIIKSPFHSCWEGEGKLKRGLSTGKQGWRTWLTMLNKP